MYLNIDIEDSGKKMNFSLECDEITVHDVINSLKSFGIEISFVLFENKYFLSFGHEKYEMNVPFDEIGLIKLSAEELMSEVNNILLDSELENFTYTLE